MRFWNFSNSTNEEVELRINGEIMSDDDGWFYEWFGIPVAKPSKFRKELSQHKDKAITVWIDSWGGDVFAGVGIYNALKSHKGKVTVRIDGKAVSAGSLIAMAGDEIIMSPGSIMMIHNPWSSAVGESKDMRKAADVLDEVKEAILNIYQTKVSGKSREEISNLMDNEEWMSARKAVNEGFADSMMDLVDDESQINNSYSVSRIAIMNSANSVMQRFLEQFRKSLQNEEPAAEPPENNKNSEQERAKQESLFLLSKKLNLRGRVLFK
ncbi:head maturation protease, ClpP-related [Paenibacillus pinihumi]|uniref:head maturation protease, ClpP-related n=1 Tax=Paenibacillus pinihumi TaxID=669462 RepID=UPI0003F5E0A8|nr:head maturation protease, ClpP-related [Paenibacillus pinihumi]